MQKLSRRGSNQQEGRAMPSKDPVRAKHTATKAANKNHAWEQATPRVQEVGNDGTCSGSKRLTRYEAFTLHSIDDQSLRRLIDKAGNGSTGKLKTCVVSIISRDALGRQMREHLVNAILPSVEKSRQPKSGEAPKTEPNYENQLHGQVDLHDGLVVLSLESFLNNNKLLSLSEGLPTSLHENDSHLPGNLKEAPLLQAWPSWNQNLLKTLQIIFSLSHIVVFYNPTPSIDFDLIRLLKILECQRNQSKGRISELLVTLNQGRMFPQQWIKNSRIHCPRALFICDTSLQEGSILKDYRTIKNNLEDQIYYLLKKNDSIATLMNLPENEEFVFLLTKRDSASISSQSHEQQVIAGGGLHSPPLRPEESRATHDGLPDLAGEPKVSKSSRCLPRFKKFIDRNISAIYKMVETYESSKPKQSQKQGFDDAIVMPRLDDFFNVMLRMKYLLYPLTSDWEISEMPLEAPNWSNPDERRFIDVYDSSNIDVLFSENYCQKARMAALELYRRGMKVGACGEREHSDLLASARSLYLIHARGPALSRNLKLLVESCDRFRYNVQVGGRPAEPDYGTNKSPNRSPQTRQRRSPSKPNADQQMSITRRASGHVKVVTSCSCGQDSSLLIKPSDRRKKLERVDIYQVYD